jgi:hypothetical protein
MTKRFFVLSPRLSARVFWVEVRGLWFAAFALACASLSTLVFSAVTLHHSRTNEAVAQRQLAASQEDVRGAAAMPDAAKPTGGFVSQLSALPSSQRIASTMQQVAQSSAVRLETIRLQSHVAAPDRLARTDATFELVGPYAAAKMVLADLLARLPSATLTRAQWRSDAIAGTVQASMVISVWGPASAEAAAPTAH